MQVESKIENPKSKMPRYAVIMAGGSGTRLWPLSRQSRPKQMLRLFEGRSLLRWSYERLAGLLAPEQICVITSGQYIPAVAEELPELPPSNLLAEPCPRDTANAVGLAATLLALREGEAIMGVFTADHIIRPLDRFCEIVDAGYVAAEEQADALVTFGIRPTGPHTGYGYIQRGAPLGDGLSEVIRFREKPDRATAEHYLAGGQHSWNSGMFVWRVSTLLAQFRKHQPAAADGLADVAACMSDPGRVDDCLRTFSELPRISIDYAIMEKADRVICQEMDLEWLDVGSWTSLADVFSPDEQGNTVVAPRAVLLDSHGNIVVNESGHLIAAVGVENLVVIHSQDATLICPRDQAQRIKDLLEVVKQRSGSEFL